MKTLLVVGEQKDYINPNDVAAFGVNTVRDITKDEFAALDFNPADTIIIKGIIETADLMRIVLQLNKNLGGGFLSHCGVFRHPTLPRPFILTDAALNIAPTLEDKKHITQNAINLARRLKLSDNPSVNFLTPSGIISPKIKSSTDADALEKYFAEISPEIRTTHFAFDVCFSENSRNVKKVQSAQPDILICDNIDQGNSTWKALTIFNGFSIAGFVVGNPALPPVLLNSRGDSKSDKIWAIELACK